MMCAHDLLYAMRAPLDEVCGCFPTGRHYPGIAGLIASTVTEVAGLAKHVDAAASWIEHKVAVIDFETTGLSAENDRVLEVGVACFERGELTARKSWLVNPGIPVPEQSRAVHKISDEMLRDAPAFAAIVPELEALLGDHLPVAYNADFDRGFLYAELTRAGRIASDAALPPAFDSAITWIDPLVWSRELHKDQRGHKLTDVCTRLGIVIDAAHRAASDAEAAGRVLLALATRMPTPYGELIRLQTQYAARQSLDQASSGWRRRG